MGLFLCAILNLYIKKNKYIWMHDTHPSLPQSSLSLQCFSCLYSHFPTPVFFPPFQTRWGKSWSDMLIIPLLCFSGLGEIPSAPLKRQLACNRCARDNVSGGRIADRDLLQLGHWNSLGKGEGLIYLFTYSFIYRICSLTRFLSRP